LAEKWAIEKPPVCMFGTEIKINEFSSYERLQAFIALQEKLMKDENYPCKQCPLFFEHVS
jgi:hypothetical protein